jgi:HNH endonuclease
MMCDCDIPELLQGAHIKPVAGDSDTIDDSVGNCLILCANHHLAFDRGLVTICSDTGDFICEEKIKSNLGLTKPSLKADVLKFVAHNLSSRNKKPE